MSAIARTMFEEEQSPSPSPVKLHVGIESNAHIDSRANETETRNRESAPMSDSDSDVEIRRPLGRAARRMLGGQRKPELNPSHRSEPVSPSITGAVPSSEDELYTATPARGRRKPTSALLSTPANESQSPLFMSPVKSSHDISEDELPTTRLDGNARLAALVEAKRAERIVREAAETQRKEKVSSDIPDEILEDSHAPVNEDIERIMSDAVKPVRKASKKAILEMERETQRLVRQQALAHQMKVRKKFTTSDLFARFNFHPGGVPNDSVENTISSSSAPNSDAGEATGHEPVSTPPSSPPTPLDRQRALVEEGALSKMVPVREDSFASIASLLEQNDDQLLPDVANIISSAGAIKQNSVEAMLHEAAPKRGLKLARLGKKAMARPGDISSDDDLEIVKDQSHHLSIFDKAKGAMKRHNTDSKAIHTLKHLAYVGMGDSRSGGKKKGGSRPSVNPHVLEAQLRARAKEQARAQQLERIAELKAKGIEVQTSEEREREQEAFENLLEKAREEAMELRKAEKAATKANGDAVASDDESEDEDYIDQSGSELEDNEGEESGRNDIVDDAAEEVDDDDEKNEEREEEEEEEEEGETNDDDSEQGIDEDEDAWEVKSGRLANITSIQKSPIEASTTLQTPFVSQARQFGRKLRRSRVVIDDDDTDTESSQKSPPVIGEGDSEDENEDPFAAFGFGAVAGSSLMSPTQAFHATMQTPTQATQQEPWNAQHYTIPPSSSSLPPISPMLAIQKRTDDSTDFIPGSQVSDNHQIDLAWELRAPETPVPGTNRSSSKLTQETPGWQPTQDDGLPATFQRTPSLRGLGTLESISDEQTQSTVRLRISESPAPSSAVVATAGRKRLVRGQRVADDSSDDENVSSVPSQLAKKDAFREMARKRREALSAAELAEAEKEAKNMMDEQAEESEDEYAGLGGDDFVAPENEQDREMIDSSLIDVNERELAALFAERQRADDEAAASKLYKDLTTGALRRKQANAFDLDEDEDDLAVRRRQMRQREEARKRKLLLQDDNIAGLAEGKPSKGKDAFLKAIADDDERNEEALDLSEVEEDENPSTQGESQQSQQPPTQVEPLQEISGNKRRAEDLGEDRPPAKQRRTKASAFRPPTSLLEVKESVSFLLDEPHATGFGPSVMEFSSDSENDEMDEMEVDDGADALQAEMHRVNDGGFAPDQVAMPPPRLPASQRRTAPKPAVVDRLSLKRGSSASESAIGRTAWAASVTGGFKVPSLLRRATTNTAFAANERGVTTSNGSSREDNGVKMGGSRKSSLAYQARAEERKAIVEAGARRRAENTARIAQLRRAASSGFGKGMSGTFE